MEVAADLVSCLIALPREEKVFGPGRKCFYFGECKQGTGDGGERWSVDLGGGVGDGNLNRERARSCAELEPGTPGGNAGVTVSAGKMTRVTGAVAGRKQGTHP